MDSDPWCERCIHYLTSSGGNVALAVAFFLSATAIAWWGARWELGRDDRPSVIWALVVVGAAVGALYVATRRPPVLERQVTERRPDELPQPKTKRGHPYRVAVKRVSAVVASPVSGVKTAVLVMLSMLLVALALPGLLELPRLVEFEMVVAAFWLLWAGVSASLLYHGFRVADDHVLARPRAPWEFWQSSDDPRDRRGGEGCWAKGGCVHVEALAPLAILAAAFFATWLVVEVVFPVLFFLAYLAVRSALAAIANDEHHCQGQLGRAIAWGFAWSSLYIFPLAGTLALVHWLAR